MSPKQDKADLVKVLRERRGYHEVETLIRLLELQVEEMKCKLMTCLPEEVARYQGMAQAYDRMLQDLTRQVPVIPTKE